MLPQTCSTSIDMPHPYVDDSRVTDSQRSAAWPAQRLLASDVDSLFSGLYPLDPEGDWLGDQLDDQHHNANTAQDPPTVPNNAAASQASLLPVAFVERWLELSLSRPYHHNTPAVLELGGQQYPTCCICPSVASLVAVNALCHLHGLARHLPTRISPSNLDSPLPSYVAELPEGAVYSTVCVLVSWPEHHHLSASSRLGSHELVQSKSVTIRTHLENTAQLIRMGLTGNQNSQGQQLHQIRLAQAHQDDEQGSSLRYLDTNCAEEREEQTPRKTSKRRADHEHPNAKTGGPTHDIHSTSSTPFSAQEYTLVHEQPQEAPSPISGIRMQDGHPSSAFNNDKLSSENVQLFLDHDGSASEFHMIFKPSLLLKRFQAWTGTMESHGTLSMPYNESGFSADPNDPSLLHELGEILNGNGLDLDTYMHLCSRHRPRSLSCSVNELSSSILGNENEGSTDIPESDISGKKDEPDLLDEYCTLDESSQETISRSEQEQDTAMRLPRILSWFVSSLDAASALATAQDSHACCPGPDFILQETTMDCKADCFQTTVQGTLEDIWKRLNKQQQQRLMLTLVKILVDIWNNFDILSHSELRDSLEPSKDAYFDDPLELLLQQCGAQQHAKSSLQQLPPTCASHMSPISDRGQSSSPRRREGSAGRTPVRASAAERLVYLEDEFLNRSFLDAFMHATAPSPSGNRLSLDTIVSVSDDNLLPVPQESSQPEKRRRIDTKQGQYSQGPASDGRSTCEEGMSRTLDSMGSSQRMTTTRAQVLEFMASQKSCYVVAPIDGDVSAGTGIRQFDFSMDDLLVAVTNETYPHDGDGQLCPSEYSKCDIVGVSRWKAGTRTLESQTPRGNNVYQVRARGSAYPLVHLFSLPDIFCPVELGGQCSVKRLDSGGIAGEFVRLLGRHSLAAGEFMTDTLPEKERVLYHRWMAAWHERSPLAPKASKMRFELMRMVNRHKFAGVGYEAQWEHLNTARTLDNNAEDDDRNSEGEGAGVELEEAAPLPYKPLRPIQQGLGDAQQPSSGGVSSAMAANLKARCSRCVEEEHEQEMTSEDKAWFDSTAQFLDEVQAEEKRRREQQEIRRLSRTRMDQALDQLARQLGLGKQWTKQGRALGLRLDGLGVPSTDGAKEAVDDTSDSLGGRPKPTWILSAEEREVMRKHLFGQSDQAAVSAEQSNVSLQHSAY